jgi:drug/metabolite transporter (DMT)-like permease
VGTVGNEQDLLSGAHAQRFQMVAKQSEGGVRPFSLLLVRFGNGGDVPAHLAFLLGPWTEMGAEQWGAVGLLSTAIIVGSLGAAIAYQIGRSSTVATFDFAYVAFAAIWGFFLFDEVPDRHAMAGIVLIVGAGI